MSISNYNTSLTDNNLIVNNLDEDLLNYYAKNILNAYEEKEFFEPYVNDTSKDYYTNELKDNFVKKQQDLIEMVEEDKEHVSLYFKLFRQVPEIHKNYVLSIIRNQFKDNVEEYIKTIPYFFSHFSIVDKKICDDEIASSDSKERRQLKKKKKHLILYSAQLLKLVGLNRSSIITNDCVKYYKDEMQKTDDFLAQFRLINSGGSISKLTSMEDKQKQKVAQILKISDCMSYIAKDKNYSFFMLTLTLPPAFHSNPLSGNTKAFKGYTPQESLNTINRYWRKIRAHLNNNQILVGQDYFGLGVSECMTSSVLHTHTLIYCSLENKERIQAIIEKVRCLENRKYNDKKKDTEEKRQFNQAHRIGVDNWNISDKDDTKVTNDLRSGALYLFKYILKTHTNYNDGQKDDSALKNMACHFFYQCRSFNFFGLDGSITKFNYLVKNARFYEDELGPDLYRVLKTGDYYDFLNDYQDYFENVYSDDEDKLFLGVAFYKSQYEKDLNAIENTILNQEIVLIEKKQYCVFEKFYKQEITRIEEMDLSKEEFNNVEVSFNKVKEKQNIYDMKVKSYLAQNKFTVFTAGDNSAVALLDEYNFGKVQINEKSQAKTLSMFNANKLFNFCDTEEYLPDLDFSSSLYVDLQANQKCKKQIEQMFLHLKNDIQVKPSSNELPNYVDRYLEELIE